MASGASAAKAKPAWGILPVVILASFAAEALSSALGIEPALKIGALETKSVEGLLEVVLPSSISSDLVTWFGFVLAGLTASLVIITGLVVPKERSLKTSIAAGLVTAAMLLLAWAVSDEGVLTGIATGLIMFFSSLAARQSGPLGAMGSLAGTLYFLFAILGVTEDLKGSGLQGAEVILELSLVGTVVGVAGLVLLYYVWVLTGWKPIPERPTPEASPNQTPPPSFFARGPGLRYAIVRGLLLGVAMGFYQVTGNHSIFWVMLAIWVVLQPVRSKTWEKAAKRGVGILAGCLLVAAIASVVSGATLIWIAIALFLVGFAYYPVNYTIFAASISFLVVTLYGDASQAGIVHWGIQRVLDNAIGIAIALLSAYLILPGDDEAARKPEEPATS